MKNIVGMIEKATVEAGDLANHLNEEIKIHGSIIK